MPHPFGPKLLRIRTPKTSDGKTLEYDENGQIIYTEQIVPLSARKFYEKENERTPTPYRHKLIEIDETKAPDPKPLIKGAGISVEEKREALLKQLAELGEVDPVDQTTEEAQAPEKKKTGRPKNTELV